MLLNAVAARSTSCLSFLPKTKPSFSEKERERGESRHFGVVRSFVVSKGEQIKIARLVVVTRGGERRDPGIKSARQTNERTNERT